MESVCQFNKFGFCKFRRTCFRNHGETKCENAACKINECPFRHPQACRYFALYKNCKFETFCKFNHEKLKDVKDEQIKNIKKELDELRIEIEEKEREINLKEREILQMNKNLQTKLNDLEKGHKLMNGDISKLNKNLHAKLNDFEKRNELNEKI